MACGLWPWLKVTRSISTHKVRSASSLSSTGFVRYAHSTKGYKSTRFALEFNWFSGFSQLILCSKNQKTRFACFARFARSLALRCPTTCNGVHKQLKPDQKIEQLFEMKETNASSARTLLQVKNTIPK